MERVEIILKSVFYMFIVVIYFSFQFVQIIKDKQNFVRERKTIRVQYSQQQEYESKVNEIGELRSRLKSLVRYNPLFVCSICACIYIYHTLICVLYHTLIMCTETIHAPTYMYMYALLHGYLIALLFYN